MLNENLQCYRNVRKVEVQNYKIKGFQNLRARFCAFFFAFFFVFFFTFFLFFFMRCYNLRDSLSILRAAAMVLQDAEPEDYPMQESNQIPGNVAPSQPGPRSI